METGTFTKSQPETRTKFWLKWLGWNAIGYFTLLLVNLILQVLSNSGLISFQSQTLVGALTGIAAIVLESVVLGWTQQLALKRYLKKPGIWFMATALSWGLISLLNGGSFYAIIQNQLLAGGTAGNIGNTAWLMILAFLVIVGEFSLSGLFQWLALRLEIRRANPWLLWTAGGWVVYGLAGLIFRPLIYPILQSNAEQAGFTVYIIWLSLFEFILYMVSPAVNGLGMARRLIPRPAAKKEAAAGQVRPMLSGKEARQAEGGLPKGEDAIRKQLVLRLALVTVAAVLAARILTYVGLANFLAELIAPLLKTVVSANLLAMLVSSFLAGLLIGWAQVLVLGSDYSHRWMWVAATVIGFLCEAVNAQIPVNFIYNWAAGSQGQVPNLFYEYFRQFSTMIGFWLALGLVQTLALLQWIGRRAWAWVGVVLAVEAAALLIRMISGYQLEQAALAIGLSWALVFFLRTGWQNVIVLVPQTDTPPSPDEVNLAVEILTDRFKDSYPLRGQFEIEDGALLVSFNNQLDAELAAELAYQRGKVVFFEATAPLENGAPLPAEVSPLITEAEILSVSVEASAGKTDRLVLKVQLSDVGFKALSDYWQTHPEFTMGFALDGEVLMTFPAEPPDESGIAIADFSYEDAHFLTGIINNEPLPFIFKPEEAE